MSVAPLAATLRRVSMRPPKKFHPSLVSDVYSTCRTVSDLDDVVSSRYFTTVLWRFFHPDITNSHLELLLQTVCYQTESLGETTYLSIMTRDADQLDKLVSRILHVSLKHKESNSRLESCIFLFIRVLVIYAPSVLCRCEFYSTWKQSIFQNYLQSFTATPATLSSQGRGVLNCFLQFCLACAVAEDKESGMKSQIKDLWLPLYFMDEDFDYKSRRLSELIALQTLHPESIDFVKVQVSVYNSKLDAKLPMISSAPSQFDVSSKVLLDELNGLSNEEIAGLAQLFGYEGPENSPLFVARVIYFLLMGYQNIEKRMRDPVFSTEEDIFDLFEDCSSLLFFPDCTLPKATPVSIHWVKHIKFQNTYNYLKSVNYRANEVFKRLTIIDPSTDQGIKGTSKYFFRLSGIEVYGSKADLKLNNKYKLPKDLAAGDNILLLELEKPNKYGGEARVIKHGIISCSLTSVAFVKGSITIHWRFNGFESRYNAFMLVPNTGFRSDTSFSPPIDEDNTIAGLATNEQSNNLDLRFSVNDVDESVFDQPGTMKKAKSETLIHDEKRLHIYNSCKVVLNTTTGEPLREDMSRALLSMVSKRFSVTQVPGGFENVHLMNSFLETIHANWREQSCLVVLPTQASVDLFPISDFTCEVSYKTDTNHAFLKSKVQAITEDLAQVAKISKILGLDEYDFGASIENALMLYELHVEPRWRGFLKYLSEKTLSQYPFAKLSTEDSFEERLRGMAIHYASIRSLFARLARFLPFDKFDLSNLRGEELRELETFFVKKSKFVVVSKTEITRITDPYDNVIVTDIELLPALRQPFKRVAVISERIACPEPDVIVYSTETRNEISSMVGKDGHDYKSYNPGIKYVTQHIRVASTKEHLNLEEATYCVYLYQYMRLLGYPQKQISLVVKSGHMRLLIEEILAEQNIRPEDASADEIKNFRFGWPIIQNTESIFASDYMIISCTGPPSIRELQSMAVKARRGLYFVGALELPFEIHSGDLEVCTGESYGKPQVSRSKAKLYHIEDAAHMKEYVEQMTEQRVQKSTGV